jgi:guanylate kinase
MPKLVLLSGCSGVGKTTIAHKLMSEMPNIERLVTYTTRKPRPGEQNGEDYNFVTVHQFEYKIKNNELFEYDKHYGHYYGNSKKDLEAIWSNDNIALILLDINGTKTVKKIYPEAASIFLKADTLDNLKNRIRQRPMSDNDFDKRWSVVRKELAKEDTFDFSVINAENEIDQAVSDVIDIIEN